MVLNIVHPAIVACFSQTMELVSELKAQLNAQIPRLRILREKKAEDPGMDPTIIADVRKLF
jgi:hypothetical protein